MAVDVEEVEEEGCDVEQDGGEKEVEAGVRNPVVLVLRAGGLLERVLPLLPYANEDAENDSDYDAENGGSDLELLSERNRLHFFFQK